MHQELKIRQGFLDQISTCLQFALGQAEPGEYLDRRVEIWNLFFRMMTVAFVIGAVVSGTLIWLILRFRESNPKATPTKYEGTGELDS